MRALVCFALLLPCPALAETIAAQSRITAVTVYPYGAEITREVMFDAPAGTLDLVITDLPATIDPAMVRLAPRDGLSVGAYGLRTGRLPPRDADGVLTPAQQEAKAEVERLEGEERAAQSKVAAIAARIEAGEAQIAFLRGVAGQTTDTATADSLRAVSGMIAAEVLAARQAVIAAQADLYPAQSALEDVQKDLGLARAAFDQQASVDAEYTALSVAVTHAAAGSGTLTVTHFVQDASWQPVYDMKLTRTGDDALMLSRGVLVTQYSGEDWAGVKLTLSTAQPSAQAAPSGLWPEFHQIVPEGSDDAMAKSEAGFAEPVMEAEMVDAAAPMRQSVSALAGLQGDTVVYRYPAAVDVADGVENLRLALDDLTVAPTVEAWAVPRVDRTAFMMATVTNTTGEVLLPGTAYLYREGVLVGSTGLDTMAPGEEGELPFGAIEGLRLTRDMPVTAEGDRGVFVTSTRREETAVLEVENLTDEAWPVRLMDQVPYSEQEDLEVTYTAAPAPTEVDVDGQRGILAWDLTVAAGETAKVDLTTVMQWPEGMVLQ